MILRHLSRLNFYVENPERCLVAVKSWIEENLRVLVILNFVLLLDLHWLGLTSDALDPKHVDLVTYILEGTAAGWLLTGFAKGFVVDFRKRGKSDE